MGDRSNIVVEQRDGSRIWLYGHWMGNDNFRVTGEVLSWKQRWDDADYLARMLFCKMTENEPAGSATGFGISTRMADNEYPIVVVDTFSQSVIIEQYDWDTQTCSEAGRFSFERFIEIYPAFESLPVQELIALVTA